MDSRRPFIREMQGGEVEHVATDKTRARARLADAKALLAGGVLDEADAFIRKALSLAPDDAETLAAAATLHLKLSQSYFDRARQLDPALAESKAMRKRVAAHSEGYAAALDALAGRLADAPTAASAPPLSSPAPWPNRQVTWQNTDRVFRRYVLAETAPEAGLITRSTQVLAMGSCFAENISKRLAQYGMSVHYQRMREELNTTFANERIVRWAIEGVIDADGAAIEALLGPEARVALREALVRCEVYIFSLGVAPALFDRNGDYVLSLSTGSLEKTTPDAAVRTSGPAENAEALRRLIKALRSVNPGVQVFLTLSPVPLAGSAERRSAILADCVSKSSLRLAIEAVMAARMPGVRYWPSFEMAKWWGAHMAGGNAFGDDGESRHVSQWLIDAIIDLFVEHYGDGTLVPIETAAAS